jgi:GxxExxY protein
VVNTRVMHTTTQASGRKGTPDSFACENPMELNDITGQIIDASMKVHTELGPGLLESAYEACLAHELRKRGLKVVSQLALPVKYDGIELDTGYRIDSLVEDRVIVELKAVEKTTPLHEAQLLSYLKLSNKKIGLLINFNVVRLKDGIKRMAN